MFNNNQMVEMKWSISNKKYFKGLGYEFTAYKDTFKVIAKDLKKGSDVRVVVTCDYCEDDITKTYRLYNKQIQSTLAVSDIHKDCCKKCIPLKTKELENNRRPVEDYDELQVIEDYEAGMSYLDIRRKYKISDGILSSIKEKNGIENKLNSWSNAQIELLKTLYPIGDWDTMLKEFYPSNKQAIHTKAHRLKISMDDFYWTKEEELLLLGTYEEKSFDELMEIFPNRFESSIQTKANKLNIRKKNRWTENELVKLKAMYENYPNEMLIEFFPERNSSSITDMAGALNLKKSENASNKYKEKISAVLLDKLKEFANLLGKTPTSLDINNEPTMPGIVTYHRYFETYSNACELAGLEVNESMFRKSYHLKSINGDTCLSQKEQMITNLLINQGIGYQKEVMYKDIISGYDEKMIRCDWLIDDNIIIEYFGMPEREDYRKRMNEKIELCKSHDVPLIALYQEDLATDFKGLRLKFKEFDIQIA